MTTKKKISRKELLKKPDEFITLSNRVLFWIKGNYQKVIWIGSGVILLIILYVGYTAYDNRQERLAHEKYFSTLEMSDSDKKLKALETLIEEFPRTKAAFTSQVTVGHLYYQKKDFPRAVSAYQTALSKGQFPTPFRILIHENLAYSYEQKGDLQQAAKAFLEISQEKETLLKEDAYLNLARVYQKMGKPQEAKATYQSFLKTFPKSIYATMIQDRLAKL